MAESELALSDSKVNELNRMLTLAKEANQESSKLHKAELSRVHEVFICLFYTHGLHVHTYIHHTRAHTI